MGFEEFKLGEGVGVGAAQGESSGGEAENGESEDEVQFE